MNEKSFDEVLEALAKIEDGIFDLVNWSLMDKEKFSKVMNLAIALSDFKNEISYEDEKGIDPQESMDNERGGQTI